jgi:hypothetical protein
LMLLTKEKKVISIFSVFLDFIKILKSYKCAVFSFSRISPLLPAAAAPTSARTVVAFFVADTEVGVEEAELPNCTVNRAVATVQQLILNSSSSNLVFNSPSKSVFKSVFQNKNQIHYLIVFQSETKIVTK